MPLENSIAIGLGVTVFVLVILTIGAIYWHHREMNYVKREPNLLASYTTSSKVAFRSNSLTGVRLHSTPSLDTSIKLESSNK
jgi:hypothetical protein